MTYTIQLVRQVDSVFPGFACLFQESEQAFISADGQSNVVSLSIRINHITKLVNFINRSGGINGHSLFIESENPQTYRVILNDKFGLRWRAYAFQPDFLFCFVQNVAQSLTVA